MKAAEPEVQVTLSMKEFLRNFFNLYETEAATLAGILGYDKSVYEDDLNEDGTWMSTDEFIQNKIDNVMLLKGETLPESIPTSLGLKIEALEKKYHQMIINQETLSSNEGNTTVMKGDSNMDEVQISTKELDVLKADALSAKESLKELEVLKGQMSKMQDEAKAKVKADMADLVKGYSFVPEADQEGLVAFLVKSEGAEVVLATLEKARDAISASVEIESGTLGDTDAKDETYLEKSANLVADILKARKV